MKSKLFKILKQSEHPISVQYELIQKEYKKFHFHEQVQITFVKKGKGTLICGNTSVNFDGGNLFVLGEGVSHVFIADENEILETFSMYFYADWLLRVLENNLTTHFLKSAQRIILVEKFAKNQKLVEQIVDLGGVSRLIGFFTLIDRIVAAPKKFILSNAYSSTPKMEKDASKLDKVFEYINRNFRSKITLEELASLSNLTKGSFCRYFKQRTNKQVMVFVNELRINYACKLLLDTELGIEEICYKSGFNNFSNFIRQFQKFTDFTPKSYRKEKKALLSKLS